MKKMIMAAPKKSVLVDVPAPEITENQVLVKVKYCGVCMSEHYDWSTAKQGRAFGHEPMGVVERVGAKVTRFFPGQRVSGVALEAFAEYVAFEEKNLVHVPDNVRDEDATVEPLACLVSAASKLPVAVPGDPVAVVGTGYMGLGMIALFKAMGAGRIIAVDVREEALENARRFGATEAYLPHQIPKGYLAPMSDIFGGGLPVVSEWGETDESLRIAGEMTQVDGILGIGAYHTGGNRSVDMQLWNVKALTAISTHERKEDFLMRCCQSAMDLLSSGLWQFTGLNTRIYGLDEFDQAHRDLEEKPDNVVKLLVDCTKWEKQ